MARLWQRNLAEHDERWCFMRDGREPWDRESKIDRDYEAGKIFTENELYTYWQRKQPATRFELIRRAVNLICGIEAQTRSDGKALPRTPKSTDGAEAMTKLIKFESDRSKFPRQVSRAFRDMAITGVGYLELGYQADPSKPQIFANRVAPELIYGDPTSLEPDWADALDICRAGYYRPYELISRFPKFTKEIKSMVNVSMNTNDYHRLSHSSDYANLHNGEPPMYGNPYPGMYNHGQQYFVNGGSIDRTRGLILGVERWYRDYQVKTVVKLKDGRVYEVTDENYEKIAQLLLNGDCTYPETVTICVIRVACFIPGQLLLQDTESPYTHGEFPISKMQAYTDDLNLPCGVVRAARDPQKEYAARKANALKRILGTKWLTEQGAVKSMERFRRQVNSNETVVELNEGGLQKIRKESSENIPAELELAADAQRMVYDSVGITQELLGQSGAAKSGTAIERLQNQGQTALHTIFDNRNWTLEQCYRQMGVLIANAYSEEMAVRVNQSGRGIEFITVNKQNHENGSIENDINTESFDYVLTTDAYQSTNQLAQLSAINGFLANAPDQIKLAFAPEVARLMALPNSTETVQKIEQIVDTMLGTAISPDQAAVNPAASAPMGAESTSTPGGSLQPGGNGAVTTAA